MQLKNRLAIVFVFSIGSISYLDFVSFAAPQVAVPAKNSPAITADQRTFFESKIRPVLQKNCYGCHSAQSKEIEGGLLLDSKAGLQRGGDDGVVVVPGNADKSLLIQALRYTKKDLQMPPDDGGGKLSDSIIHDFEAWVKMGAPDPRDEEIAAAPKAYDTTEAKKWWSFQPLKRPDSPQVIDSNWVQAESDKFVLAALEAKNIKPVADADKQTLIRRVYFDLIGLPPTPAEVDAFVRSTSPNAYSKMVDDLLARPQFGEHWGRHWLDVARYGESSGKDVNVTFPNAWRYRDYVVASFNQDKPYDQFVREQLAGDLMPTSDPKERAELDIATGFLAVGPKGLDEMTQRQFDLDLADEQLDTTCQSFIGLTVSCARCHDHKFDPILQTDYYGIAGIFLSSKTDYGTLAGAKNNQESDLIELPREANLPTVQENLPPSERQRLSAALDDITKQYNDLIASRQAARRGAAANPPAPNAQLNNQIRLAQGRIAQLESALNSYYDDGKPKAFCMGVHDRPAAVGPIPPVRPIQVGQLGFRRVPSGFETIADSPLFFRGEMSDPRDRVPRGIPAFLSWSGSPSISRSESGRKELADWIVSPTNPLASRVMANRIWYWLFGQGIVSSVDNFGTMGDSPANQPLLDYLATHLIDNNWSIKKTIRDVVLSHAYQLAPTYDEVNYAADPQNSLVWRHSKRRLNAECIRDAMLASSGQLNLTPPIGSSVAVAGNGTIGAGPPAERINDETFVTATSIYRSVYLPDLRNELPGSLEVFDYPDSGVVTGARETTNVPSQALYLLNNEFVLGQSRLLASRLIAAYPTGVNQKNVGARTLQDRVNMGFRLTMGRSATVGEQNAAAAFFSHMTGDRGVNSADAWSDFCLALFNTAEFRYLN